MDKRLVVLCVDDEETVLESLELELRSRLPEECILELAQSGQEALELSQEYTEKGSEIALVLCDYIMPNLKGDEVMKRIHETYPKTHKIMLTGQAELAGVVRAVNEAKLYRYIAKPWEREDLYLTVAAAIDHYRQSAEMEKTYSAMEKFVPVEFLQYLGINSISEIKFGDCIKKELTVMFSDIRSFTTISEGMSPQKNFNYLNAYFAEMGPVIRKNHGFINKYLGDGIMAIFPEPDDAVNAGLDMLEMLYQFNQTQHEEGKPEISIGIGIHTGRVILGTVGEASRMETTVIGDTVNVAARLEQITKEVGVPLLVSARTYELIDEREQFLFRYLGPMSVRGKEMHVPVFEVYNADNEELRNAKNAIRDLMKKAVASFQDGELTNARRQFEECLSRCPNDTAIQYFIKKCNSFDAAVLGET